MDQNELERVFGSYHAYKFNNDTWFISFMNGSQLLFLLEGEKNSLLIDTGYAVGNLRSFVEKLTDKPVLVCNTHFHPDHSGGNGEWEKVMVSHHYFKDAPSVATTAGNLAALPYPDYEKVLLKDGDTIDLGGRIVRVIEPPQSHCNSSLYFLDTKDGMLFMGDEMDSWQVILFENSHNPEMEKNHSTERVLKNFRASLMQVKAMDGQYTFLIGNHNGSPLAKSYLDDFIGLVDSIFDGTAEIQEDIRHPFIEMDPRSKGFCRINYKKASILIEKANVKEIMDKANGTDKH